MRQSCLGIFLLTLGLSAGTGCRQATGPTGAPRTPIGPLAPSSPGAIGPTLGPFGAPTRVTPPATGSYGTANNFMGGVAPVGYAPQAGRAQNLAGMQGATGGSGLATNMAGSMNNRVIGSGVQQAGWTETNATMGNAAPSGIASPSSSGPRRDGGMRVIDLTDAPPPPGYRPYAAQPPAAMAGMNGYRSSPSISASGGYTATRGYGQNATPAYGQNTTSGYGQNATTGYRQSVVPAGGQGNVPRPPANPMNNYQSYDVSGANPAEFAPSSVGSAPVAAPLKPVQDPPHMAQLSPSQTEPLLETSGPSWSGQSQTAPSPPSTEPVPDSLSSQPNSKLPWRTPAPRF